jgi:hypothetical protein
MLRLSGEETNSKVCYTHKHIQLPDNAHVYIVIEAATDETL